MELGIKCQQLLTSQEEKKADIKYFLCERAQHLRIPSKDD